MIHPIVSIAAFFVDQVSQAPVQVQCVSNAGQDPIWVRLLFDAVPSIFALGIAALVFYWNGGRERKQWVRNQEAAHEQWIRDQKKAEWRELLDAVIACELYIVISDKKEKGEIESSACQQMESALAMLKVKHCLEDRVFIDNPKLSAIRILWEANANKTTSGNWESTKILLVEYQKLINEVRETAKKDLMVVSVSGAVNADEREP